MSQMKNVERFATCSYPKCTNPGVRGMSCATCNRHLCVRHCSVRYHRCPSTSELTDDEWQRAIDLGVEQLLDSINVEELLRVATSLNGGKPCTFTPGQHTGSGAIMGCANYHAWISFDGSGEKWLVRIPRGGFSDLPESLVEYLVASEYATLKFLETTGVPAARAFGYGLVSDPQNRVGVNYILMQALPGRPYQVAAANQAQKAHVIEQVSSILAEISKHPFPQAGSLLRSADVEQVQVSRIASNRWVHLGLYGPYDATEAYYKDIASQYVDLVADGQLYRDFPREAYLFYSYLHDRVAVILSQGELSGEFFLKHVDDKGDHILVDDSFNVTGVIDWQFTRVVPAREAFGPSMFTADLQALYSAHIGLSADDVAMSQALKSRLHPRIIEALSAQTELVRRFHFGLASGLLEDEVHGIIAGTLALDPDFQGQTPGQTDVPSWLDEQWTKRQGDPRRDKVEAILRTIAEEKA